MSATERRKGANAELEAIRILHEYGWGFAKRTSDGRTQSGRGDVANGPAGCAIEVKRHEKLNVPQALRKLSEDAGPDIPILVHRPSRTPWMATLPFEELLPLLALREFA